MSDQDLMTDAEREVFNKLLVTRYEEVLREFQIARRRRMMAECDERDAEEEIRLLQYKQSLARWAMEHPI